MVTQKFGPWLAAILLVIGGLRALPWWLLQGARPATSCKLFLSPRSIVKFARFFILTLLILMAGLAGLAVAATQPDRLDGFQLLDQNGAPAGIAPSKQATLVYFYRGDW